MVLLERHNASFPPDPPTDPDDPATVARHEWEAFSRVDTMVNHWDRPGWTGTTRAYYWLLEFHTPALIAHARACQDTLRSLPIDDIPADGIHLTLGRIGLTGDVTPQQVTNLAVAARTGLPGAFSLQAIPLTASRGAIRYSVAPWAPILALHDHLSQAMSRSGLPPMPPTAHLRPHIGVGYLHRPTPAEDVRRVLEPLRRMPPAATTVDAVHLVRMRRTAGAYRWDRIRTLPLPA
ncbi:2'-5' RNA ligase family protein [Streptomyces xanthochromogenes]|uniref:2'-5' RNA ligase family protein n=1 Tax=Streptomyces xanthochromogenes TaxID=67384 RepID=UPI00378B8049